MRRSFWRKSGRWLVLSGCGWAILCGVPGCGKADAGLGKTVPVLGQVTFKGRPLTTGLVIFRPDAKKGNALMHEPRGGIDDQGNFELTINGKKGVPTGWYRVSVIASEAFDPAKPYVIPKKLIPLRYTDPKTSGFALQVVETPAPAAYDLKLGP